MPQPLKNKIKIKTEVCTEQWIWKNLNCYTPNILVFDDAIMLWWTKCNADHDHQVSERKVYHLLNMGLQSYRVSMLSHVHHSHGRSMYFGNHC